MDSLTHTNPDWTRKEIVYVKAGIYKERVVVRPEKFQFLKKWQNRNFDYKIVISVKNPKLIL